MTVDGDSSSSSLLAFVDCFFLRLVPLPAADAAAVRFDEMVVWGWSSSFSSPSLSSYSGS